MTAKRTIGAALGIILIAIIIIGVVLYAWAMIGSNHRLTSGANQGQSQPPQSTHGRGS